MPFQTDTVLATESGRFFGDYQGTFFSEHGEAALTYSAWGIGWKPTSRSRPDWTPATSATLI